MLYRQARRLVILVVGFTVIAVGVVMIVAPGPATIVIPAGLAILATEFLWARRLLNRLKEGAKSMLPESWGATVDKLVPGKKPKTSPKPPDGVTPSALRGPGPT